MKIRLQRNTGILGVDPASWNSLAGDSPFLRYEFLAALEETGCVGDGTAWHPCHITALDSDDRLVGGLPLYLKYDSRGEFVFDWGWANAYEQAGLDYYPKLVSAVPFTPATGNRVLALPGAEFSFVADALLGAARELGNEVGASSLHVLFPTDQQRAFFAESGLLTRKSCQFHWHNHGYRNFDDFLGRFNSAKRKKARRERRRIAEAGIRFEHLRGDELSAEVWDTVFGFYARTFLRRGRAPYLSRAFFAKISSSMPENLVVILARYGEQPIAAAICFRNSDTLYGRYWGSLADFHSLHFETCYYQGIEYCIDQNLDRFEPGTQGEHKISRGFTPAATWSNHLIIDAEFGHAVAAFLDREREHVEAYMDELEEHVPYRRGIAVPPPAR
ncbi:MAG TPA: GNAT family N-acetyltransferase [Gammaproteobacteria bacterium]